MPVPRWYAVPNGWHERIVTFCYIVEFRCSRREISGIRGLEPNAFIRVESSHKGGNMRDAQVKKIVDWMIVECMGIILIVITVFAMFNLTP